MLNRILRRLFGLRQPGPSLDTTSAPLTEMEFPARLYFTIKPSATLLVKSGDKLKPGQPLAKINGEDCCPSPFQGKLISSTKTPDIRGGKARLSLVIEPDKGSKSAAFSKLDFDDTPRETLRLRIRKAGILTNTMTPTPLLDALGDGDSLADSLIVLVSDREPSVTASLSCFEARPRDAVLSALLLGKIAGSEKIFLTVSESHRQKTEDACKAVGKSAESIKILTLPAVYPESLRPMVAARAGGGQVITLETALAALDSVVEGQVQDRKTLTLIGADGEVLGNYRVPLGTRLSDVFAEAGISPTDRDKVIAGGFMRGIAQYSLDGVVDEGVDALVFLPAKFVGSSSNEDCINCGSCIDICPVRLQVQLIGRYSEFSLFEETRELGIDHCIDCGLCGTVCIAHRPLLQLIRLAKTELVSAAK